MIAQNIDAPEFRTGRSDAERMAANRAAIRDLPIRPLSKKSKARRARLRKDDAKWLRTYMPEVFYHPFTRDQLKYIDTCGNALRYGAKKCLAAPRGDGKSSILKYLQLKYALYGDVKFALLVCATSSKGKKSLSDIKNKLRFSPCEEFRDDFPFECDVVSYIGPHSARANNVTVGGRNVLVSWKADWMTIPTFEEDGHGPILMTLGITSDDLQGCNVFDRRPDFVMLDDLDSRDSLAAADGVVAHKIEETIDKTVAGLGGPGKQLGQVMLCTITSRTAAAYRYSDPLQKPAWTGERVKRLQVESQATDMVDEYIALRQKKTAEDPFARVAHKYYKKHRKKIEAGVIVSNEHDYNQDELPDGSKTHVSAHQKCLDFISDFGREAFQTEHQNDPPDTDLAEFQVHVTKNHIAHNCSGDYFRGDMISDVPFVGGVDIRKIEIHWALASGNRITDYDVRGHGTTETTVEESEGLVLSSLEAFYDSLDVQPDLMLIDKGWIGSWREDGETKTWASQPVETFCIDVGLTKCLPAHGAPRYKRPAPTVGVIAGDNWHMNYGRGLNRRCTEVIWNKAHWSQKVEERFLLTEDHEKALKLFQPDQRRKTHTSFANHIVEGLEDFYITLRSPQKKKTKYRKDHWFDSVAMMLVAESVQKSFKERKPRMSYKKLKGRV